MLSDWREGPIMYIPLLKLGLNILCFIPFEQCTQNFKIIFLRGLEFFFFNYNIIMTSFILSKLYEIILEKKTNTWLKSKGKGAKS
jgi:hypothetical protein